MYFLASQSTGNSEYLFGVLSAIAIFTITGYIRYALSQRRDFVHLTGLIENLLCGLYSTLTPIEEIFIGIHSIKEARYPIASLSPPYLAVFLNFKTSDRKISRSLGQIYTQLSYLEAIFREYNNTFLTLHKEEDAEKQNDLRLVIITEIHRTMCYALSMTIVLYEALLATNPLPYIPLRLLKLKPELTFDSDTINTYIDLRKEFLLKSPSNDEIINHLTEIPHPLAPSPKD